ncbi:MAG: hypothetical protein ACREH8_09860 [Opitutaceae bacterium]
MLRDVPIAPVGSSDLDVDDDPVVLPVSKLPVEPLLVPDWPRRELSLPLVLEPVLPAPLVCATAVAAPSNNTIADAKSVRRAGEVEVIDVDGFIAGTLYARGFVIPWEEGPFASPAALRQAPCDFGL